MTTRKSFSGAAVKTTISSGAFNAGATTLSLTSATGWPTTVNGPFIATIDRGLATQEQVSVGARSGLACSAITRGYAGTAEVSHAANATIEHGWDAIAADEANRIASLLTTKGDGLGHDGTQVQREPVGTAGYYLTATPAASTGRSWTAPPSSLVTAKGQVLAASASGVLVPSNTPTNGQVLIGDTTQTAGVRFGNPNFIICTSTTRPAHSAGLTIYETDTTATLQSTGTAWVEIRRLTGPTGTYSPTCVQGASTFPLSIATAEYDVHDHMVDVRLHVTFTSSGSSAVVLTITLPPGFNQANGGHMGSGYYYNITSAFNYNVECIAYSATQFIMVVYNAVGAAGYGQNPANVVINGDVFKVTLRYRWA